MCVLKVTRTAMCVCR